MSSQQVAHHQAQPLQCPVDQAMHRLLAASEMIQYRARIRPNDAERVADALVLAREADPPKTARERNYWEFLRSIARDCGNEIVCLCALGLGRSKIGNMKDRFRLELSRRIRDNRTDFDCREWVWKIGRLMPNTERGLLHRASVFLFDSDKRLLLQQRASEKITFPNMWTNTCYSHALGILSKTGSEINAAILGAKHAARRKLEQELGIPPEQVPVDKFEFFTRIHYQAPSDGKWGEHEMDYILFIQANVDLNINPNEVRDARYVSPTELKEMFKQSGIIFTPWFKLVCDTMLFEWWGQLGLPSLDKYKGETGIRRIN